MTCTQSSRRKGLTGTLVQMYVSSYYLV
uniref:Uncharacterized protein n=1 Tax=Arundo donax TaxID=35708 RepID=A0A0A9E7X7_ARUDO